MAGAPTLQQSSVESKTTESDDFSDLPPLVCCSVISLQVMES